MTPRWIAVCLLAVICYLLAVCGMTWLGAELMREVLP